MQSNAFKKDLNVHYDLGIKVEVLSIGQIENESPQIVQDLYKFVGDCKTAVIGKIFVPMSLRKSGVGTSIIKGIVRDFDDHVIVTVARALEPSMVQQIQLESVLNFFEKREFIPISSMIEDDREIPMLYVGNHAGKEVLQKINVG